MMVRDNAVTGTGGVISVIVPTIGRCESLTRLLCSLTVQSRPVDEVIIADGSGESGVELVLDDPRWALGGLVLKRVVVFPPHAVRQRMAAIAEARGTLLLLLDDDVELDRECVAEMERALSGHPGAVAVMADFTNQTWPGPTRIWRWYLRFGLGVGDCGWEGRVMGPLLRFGFPGEKLQVRKIEWIATCNTMVVRSAYDAAGGFSDFFLHRSTMNEDVDLGLRLGRVGDLLYYPLARLAHFHAPSGRVAPRVGAEDDLFNRYQVLWKTCGRTQVDSFQACMTFWALESVSNFLGALRRMSFSGTFQLFVGRTSAMIRIFKQTFRSRSRGAGKA
jgi:GT2 family glycosyltransferase